MIIGRPNNGEAKGDTEWRTVCGSQTQSDEHAVRNLRDGNWYWIDRALIQHYVPKIGAIGVAVYNYLASLTGPAQSCFPSQKRIATVFGCSRATVNRAIKALKDHKLISVDRRGAGHPHVYRLLRLRCISGGTSLSHQRDPSVTPADTNNNHRSIVTTKSTEEAEMHMTGNAVAQPVFRPRTREDLLAVDLSEALNDKGNLSIYRLYANAYPERLLRRAVGEAKELPRSRIRTSRAALFKHLVKVYARESNDNNGN
ncbi:MAG: helix-turn-helix domain-containing protein [Armatimonadetes bacterium]|nr:helix-turn-helix domain-containing protein [Armatimonadota bacterium]